MSLYNISSNITDFVGWLNETTSNICMNVDVPATCGAFIFWDLFLVVAWLILFIAFKRKSSFKDSYAGSSLIVTFFGVILFVMPYNFVRSTELLFLLVNLFISIMVLYLKKD